MHHDACRAALEVVDGCVEISGTAVASRGGRLARCLRDVHALRGHIAVSGDALERAGAARLGVTPPDLLV